MLFGASLESRLETPILEGRALGLGGTTAVLAGLASPLVAEAALLAWTGGGGGQRMVDEGGELGVELARRG